MRNAQCTDGFSHAAPVVSFRPNHFGLCDMKRTNCAMDRRVVRGGSWGGFPLILR